MGFRAGVDGAVYLAEDFATAAVFSADAVAARSAIGGTVIKFSVPSSMVAQMERGVLGAAWGAPTLDIVGGTGHELVLAGRHVGAFNNALRDGVITATRLRLPR